MGEGVSGDPLGMPRACSSPSMHHLWWSCLACSCPRVSIGYVFEYGAVLEHHALKRLLIHYVLEEQDGRPNPVSEGGEAKKTPEHIIAPAPRKGLKDTEEEGDLFNNISS